MSESDSPDDEGDYLRIDFQIEVVGWDEEAETVRFLVQPDPRRYEVIEIDGETHWRDKYRNIIFGPEILRQFAEQARGLPIFHAPARIERTDDYAAQRRDALDREHRGEGYTSPNEKPAQRKRLDVPGEEKSVTFVSVDIEGSSALRVEHGPAYDKAHKILLRELMIVVGQFNGSVLKTTGDGLIAFFDHVSINNQGDAAPDACLSMLRVLHDAVNLTSRDHGLPELSIRIGADHGHTIVTLLDVPDVGFSEPEVASDGINRAVKLQEAADKDTVRIGRELYERLHVNWLERCREAPPLENVGSSLYRTYVLS